MLKYLFEFNLVLHVGVDVILEIALTVDLHVQLVIIFEVLFDVYLDVTLKGILSWSAKFLYVKESLLLSSGIYFLLGSVKFFPLKSSKN